MAYDVNGGLIVGSARIDENGKTYGGKKGDQSYKEVSLQEMYYHKQGWHMARAKNANYAQAIAEAVKQACENDFIGYSQETHGSCINLIAKYGSFKAINEACADDCSGIVAGAVFQATGINLFADGNFYTGNAIAKLKATGLFDIFYTINETTFLADGDILVTATTGHTVTVVAGRPRGDISPAPTPVNKKIKLTTDCNMRAQASLNGTILQVIPGGTILEVKDEKPDGARTWAYTTYKNKSGWVSEKYSVPA